MSHTSQVSSAESQTLRRKALQRVISEQHDGNVSAFARLAKKQQSQIADMLAGRKSFGEKVARSIEAAAGLRPGFFDIDPDNPKRSVETAMIYGAPISSDAAQIGREWAKLDEPLRTQVANLIQSLVAAQIREARKPPPKGHKPNKPRRPHHHTHG